MPDAKFGEWRPLELEQLRRLFAELAAPWWLAGGRALELFTGRSWRAHGDLDVGIRRSDAAAVFATLEAWEVHAARRGSLQRLTRGEPVPPDCHNVWCRRPEDPWRFEILLDASEGSDWLFRREPSIRRPLADVVQRAANGTPYLAPEIQLLYKAQQRRPKDELDFAQTAPELDRKARDWLRAALEHTLPGHDWLGRSELTR